MTSTGHLVDPRYEQALSLALLRFGADTHACRILKELDPHREGMRPGLADQLADRLRIPADERGERVSRAHARAVEALGRVDPRLRPMAWFDEGYPELLWQIPDPPMVLWYRGDPAALLEPAVAVVGSRRASPAGEIVATRLGRGLAEAGLTVVSGLARGIDAAAHRAALDAGGRSVAILGCGADVPYPTQHQALAGRLSESGALVSEFPPGTPPLAHHFPLRNRIISGLCRAVVVVEASQRSGSLITARAALEQGRDVLAVPGTVASGHHAGCHALIKDGAGLVETVEDVLGALGWAPRLDATAGRDGNSLETSGLEAIMAVGEPYSLEELAARSGLSAPELLAELGRLEVSGRVGRQPGAGFVKFDKSAIGGGHG